MPDIFPLQLRDCFLADHASVGHNAHPSDPEPVLQPASDDLQALHVRRVSRPHLATQRVSFAVNNNARNHLLQVRPMVFRITVLPNRFAAVAFKVKRRRIKEHKIQPRK